MASAPPCRERSSLVLHYSAYKHLCFIFILVASSHFGSSLFTSIRQWLLCCTDVT